ncbi:MAG: sulfite exporter TauE/SafE family protein [Litoreibacter sp.]|uniref:sulfite exporter TauE/SafE family protein n=1 Tax=Litoreibacter sp. TaxID=1969459 RepID=UPI003299F816
MEFLSDIISFQLLVLAMVVGVAAGFVKGVVGFAMPMIFISGLSSFISPELALAGLILPTVVTNGMQGLRQGLGAAWSSMKKLKAFLCVGGVMLVMSAQLVSVIPSSALYLAIGTFVMLFATLQLWGWRPKLSGNATGAELIAGTCAGLAGGVSGIWGPPTVLFLNAVNTPKQDQMRIQGVVYGLGALLLLAAHIKSGILIAATVPFSALLVLPAVIGVWLGFKVQDRIDQAMFRRATSCVLIIAGLNLIRRGLLG